MTKLKLNRETLRSLSDDRSQEVVAGGSGIICRPTLICPPPTALPACLHTVLNQTCRCITF